MSAKKWTRNWFLSTILFIMVICILIIYFNSNGRPLRFTNSISYDAKLNFIRNSKILDSSDTIVIGSSMALNNIDGKTLEKSEYIQKVANLSSWALKTSEVDELLEAIDLKNIKMVIYVNQYFDFDTYTLKNINKQNINSYLKGNFLFYPYFYTFSTFSKNISNYFKWEKKFLDPNKYSNLGFDNNGDINFAFEKKYISTQRWSETSKKLPHSKNYEILIKIKTKLEKQNIKLVVVTTPHRKKLLANNIELKELFNNYVNKLSKLSIQHNFTYINSHKALNIQDKYFADASHLNYEGSMLLSNEITKNIIYKTNEDENEKNY